MSLLGRTHGQPCEAPILGPAPSPAEPRGPVRSAGGEALGRRVVHLEGLRPRGVARQPEQADHPLPPQLPARPDGVVVESPGQLDAPAGGVQLVEHPRPLGCGLDLGDVLGVERGDQRGREVGLGERPLVGLEVAGGARLMGRGREHHAGRRVEQLRRGELEADRRTPQQLGVEGEPRGVDPAVQVVQPACGHAEVEADRQDDDEGEDAQHDPAVHAVPPRPARRPTSWPRRSSVTFSPGMCTLS